MTVKRTRTISESLFEEFSSSNHLVFERLPEVASASKMHFGLGKTVGRIRQTVHRGLRRDDRHFKLTMTASTILRISRMPLVVPGGVMT